jgi:hypothetical protein
MKGLLIPPQTRVTGRYKRPGAPSRMVTFDVVATVISGGYPYLVGSPVEGMETFGRNPWMGLRADAFLPGTPVKITPLEEPEEIPENLMFFPGVNASWALVEEVDEVDMDAALEELAKHVSAIHGDVYCRQF